MNTCDICGGDIWKPDTRCLDCAMTKREETQMSKWQPIETAPKDGSRIIIAIKGCSLSLCAEWSGESWTTIMAGNDWSGRKVRYWQPLPTPPEENEQ